MIVQNDLDASTATHLGLSDACKRLYVTRGVAEYTFFTQLMFFQTFQVPSTWHFLVDLQCFAPILTKEVKSQGAAHALCTPENSRRRSLTSKESLCKISAQTRNGKFFSGHLKFCKNFAKMTYTLIHHESSNGPRAFKHCHVTGKRYKQSQTNIWTHLKRSVPVVE